MGKSLREQLDPLIRAAGVNEIADRAGVPRARIYDWFAGRRDMYAERVDSIIEALGVEAVIKPPKRSRKTGV
jgi:AcrR family transcriptional regulator